MIEAKFMLAGIILALVASLIGDVAAVALGTAAVFGALGYFWRIIRRAAKTYDVIEALPDTLKAHTGALADINERLSNLESRTAAIHEPVEAVARELDIHHRHSTTTPK